MQRVDDILQFIADFTVHVEGVGHVCRLVFHIYQHHKRICHLLKNFVTSDYRVVAFSYLDSDNSYGILLFFFFFFSLISVAALVPLIFKNMAIASTDHLTMQVVLGGVLRGKWRNHS